MAGSSTLAPHRPATDLLSFLGRGRASARTARELSERVGCSERTIRGAVEWLRREGTLIGSTTRDGGGFFLIETWAELEDTARQLRSRALSMLKTKSALEHAAVERFGDDALRLFSLEDVG